MEKTIKTIAVAMVAGLAICTSAMAAPKNNHSRPPAKAPVAHRTPQMKPPAKPGHQIGMTPGHSHVKTPPPPQQHQQQPRWDEPRRPEHGRHDSHRHHHHGNSTLHTEDWCEIGAVLVGGLIGGLVGASM